MFLFLALLRLSLNYLIARSLASPFLSSADQVSEFLSSFSAPTRRASLCNHWQSEYGCWYLVWWVCTDIDLCLPMMHCYQGLENSVEHCAWSLRARGELSSLSGWGVQGGQLDSHWHLGLWCFQDPPKEDLTVSEKFQLVLDVAQRAQVRRDGQAEVLLTICPCCWTDLDNRCFKIPFQRICLGSWQTSWRKYGSEFFRSQTHPQLLTVVTV